MNKMLIITLLIFIAGCTQLQTLIYGEPKVEKLKISWLGQAGFMIEDGDIRIYIDPYAVPMDQLKGDFILITHADFDHCDQASINLLLKDDAKVLTTPECGIKLGLTNLEIVEPEEQYVINGVIIQTVHAYSLTDSSRTKGTGVGFIINIEGLRIYHAGDTDLVPELDELSDIDIAIISVSNELHSMSVEDAVTLAKRLNATYTIPMQFPNTQVAREFASRVPELNVEILTNRKLVIYEE